MLIRWLRDDGISRRVEERFWQLCERSSWRARSRSETDRKIVRRKEDIHGGLVQNKRISIFTQKKFIPPYDGSANDVGAIRHVCSVITQCVELIEWNKEMARITFFKNVARNRHSWVVERVSEIGGFTNFINLGICGVSVRGNLRDGENWIR